MPTPRKTVKSNAVTKANATKNAESDAFKALPVSTQTVMAYTNCRFNVNNIFEGLPVEESPGVYSVKKVAGSHGKIYQLKNSEVVRGIPSKKGHFRNQITASIFILDKMITAKIFATGKFHLTGCKNLQHQQQVIIELMRHIRTIHTTEKPTFEIVDNKPLNIILEVVMVNVDFNLGFNVDQKKLDRLLQNSTNEFYTVYDTLINTSINIKLDYPDPERKEFNQIIIRGPPKKAKVQFAKTTECPNAKPRDTRTHTFLVFSSSKVIQSGRYYDTQMAPAYQKFYQFILDNREKIELQLQGKKFDMSQLKGLQWERPFQICPYNYGSNRIHLASNYF